MAKREAGLLIVGALLIVLFSMAVFAVQYPTFPRTLEASRHTTFNTNNYGQQSVEALAGNISFLSIDSIAQTKAWHGYYGNITGTITLDDALNNTFYNWSAAEPRGQVYATLNNSIAWATVGCFDFSASGGEANWDTIETYYNISPIDTDGVNETYTTTDHQPFQVGSRTMANCPTAYVFRNDTRQTSDFQNVLLFDNSSPEINVTGWIYTTLIENRTADIGNPSDLTCFNGEKCDFQILVNENGHGTDTDKTTYYFWVELS